MFGFFFSKTFKDYFSCYVEKKTVKDKSRNRDDITAVKVKEDGGFRLGWVQSDL